jgi:DNA-binding response OmpR family regulator
VFGEKYDESDNSQAARLNMAISRLREKVEGASGRPRYLITEPGGYRLAPQS